MRAIYCKVKEHRQQPHVDQLYIGEVTKSIKKKIPLGAYRLTMKLYTSPYLDALNH